MYKIIHRQKGLDNHYKVWHRPEKNMFILIQSGNGSIVTREKSYPMTKGMLCFIGENKYHYTFPDIPEQYTRSKLFVCSEELGKISRLLSQNRKLCSTLDENHIAIGLLSERDLLRADAIFEELNDQTTDADFFQAKVYAAILDLTVLLSQSIKENSSYNFDNIQIAVEYINHHITEDIRIDQICAACYLSKYHFCRLFKKKIGLTVMEYILKTRIAMAKELLCEAKMSVTEISEACGFSSTSFFSRTFKNEVGMSPLQYKKKHMNFM
jgi:AraC-like DNA-binding protein